MAYFHSNTSPQPVETIERSEEEQRTVESMLCGHRTQLPFSLNSLQILTKRYLHREADGNILESPEDMYRRVAVALAEVERVRFHRDPQAHFRCRLTQSL